MALLSETESICKDQGSVSILFLTLKSCKAQHDSYQSLLEHCPLGYCCQNPLVSCTPCAAVSPAFQQTPYFGLQPIIIEEKKVWNRPMGN